MSVIEMKSASTVRSHPERTFLDIVQKYSPSVLNNNWFEERLKFVKEKYSPAKSVTASSFTYDEFQEKNFKEAMDNYENQRGIEKNIIFHHHDKMYLKSTSTCYKLDYRCPAKYEDKFPLFFDLHKKYLDNEKQNKIILDSQYAETYKSFESPPERSVLNKRFGIRRDMSSQLYPLNFINKEVSLRNKNMLLAPEYKTIPQMNIT